MSALPQRVAALESVAPLHHEPRSWYVEVGIDYGTSSIKITARLRHEGEEETTLRSAASLEFFGGAKEIPAWIAFHNDIFHCGFDLSYRLSDECPPDERVPRGLVLRCLKLHLYEDFAEQNAASIFSDARKFGGKSVDDFVVEQFKYLIDQIRQCVCSSDMLSYMSREELQQLQLRARLSQPEIFTPTGCYRLQRAAREAGIQMAVCASEPQCLLAHFMDGVAGRSRFPSQLGTGAFMTIADLGCGTGDFSTFLIKSKLDTNVRLDAVQKKSGALCGADQVNRNVLTLISRAT